MKRILEQIIDRNTEGNYLLSSSNKAQMVSEILGVIGRLSFKDELKNENDNGTKPVLEDSAVRGALSTLLQVGANMLTTVISSEISEWDLPKTTPLKAKRKIIQEADKWNDVNRRRAIELKNAYDVLSRHFR